MSNSQSITPDTTPSATPSPERKVATFLPIRFNFGTTVYAETAGRVIAESNYGRVETAMLYRPGIAPIPCVAKLSSASHAKKRTPTSRGAVKGKRADDVFREHRVWKHIGEEFVRHKLDLVGIPVLYATYNRRGIVASFSEPFACDLYDVVDTAPSFGEDLPLLGYAYGAVRAVADFHSFGYGHLDVSLENFCVRADGTVAIIDFGSAVSMDEVAADRTVLSTITTKVAYMSPEVYSSTCDSPQAADIWSLAIVVCVLLTGHMVYTEAGDRLYSRLVREGPHFCLEKYNIRARHPAVYQLLHAMLDTNPKRRPSAADCCETFRAALEAFPDTTEYDDN